MLVYFLKRLIRYRILSFLRLLHFVNKTICSGPTSAVEPETLVCLKKERKEGEHMRL